MDVCVDVFVTGVWNAGQVVVGIADATLVTAADEAEPIPLAANSDLTRLKYVKSG